MQTPTIFWIILFLLGILLFWFLVHVFLFAILKLHQKKQGAASQGIPMNETHLASEQVKFIHSPAWAVYFTTSLLYLFVNREWEILRRYFWKIQFVPFTNFHLAREMRRLVWEDGQWPDFISYYTHQKNNERRAVFAWLALNIILILLIYTLLTFFFDVLRRH